MTGRKFDSSVKTVVVGDSGVGKTCLLCRFVREVFEEDQPPTLGVEFMAKIIQGKSGDRIELQLWDTAGQELFRSVTRGYYRGSIGAFLVFDISKKQSFENIMRWLSDVRSTAREGVVTVLIGNKLDLAATRQVTSEEAQAFAQKNDMMYFETSAKTGENVEAAMTSLLDRVEKLIADGKYDGKIGIDAIGVRPEESVKKSEGCC